MPIPLVTRSPTFDVRVSVAIHVTDVCKRNKQEIMLLIVAIVVNHVESFESDDS